MFVVSLDEDVCNGCGLCVESCPARILSFNDDEKKAFISGDETECMGCEACITVCESGAITIMEI
ncbi:MAG: 4Fe-4S binding protein [Syntrophomonadaceae bacterium]|nr:4Fe-4S binding protein [Syntrophomonadaceae bacterium]HAA08734.1 ferredoxin [Syntrophomonas sp.]HQA50213.1 4Fe-4S binding protein [Syntrophomonadaceae bacterium]HQD89968.1 4Fe-4S binding protein [Syntrophomonadaceae bacterium]